MEVRLGLDAAPPAAHTATREEPKTKNQIPNRDGVGSWNLDLGSSASGLGRPGKMGNRLGRKLIASLVFFVLFVLGCSNSDQDHLARAAVKAREKIKNAGGDSSGGLTGWQSMALDARVSARLRWDKTLSNEHIHVQATGGVIELKGRVHDLAQRRRAVELAESTVGTEQVLDLLEVPTQEP
jgi:hypothetical protein